MSTSPAARLTPDHASGVVTFTARGNQALEEIASGLVAQCDGTTQSITTLLALVLTVDVADLAAALDADPSIARVLTRRADTHQRGDLLDGDVDESIAGNCPDEAARRRLGLNPSPQATDAPGTPIEARGPGR